MPTNVPPYTHEDKQIDQEGLTADRNILSRQVEELTKFVNTLRAQVAAPVLASISPDTASAGDTVTIQGAHLLSTTQVKIGQVTLSGVQVLSSTKVTAVLPVGIASGTVSLTTPGGTVTGLYFTKFNTLPVMGVLTPSVTSLPALSSTPLQLSVGVTDSDGVDYVEFQRRVLVGTGNSSAFQWEGIGSISTPVSGNTYRVNHSPTQPGTLTLRAKGVDVLGGFAYSDEITVEVTAPVLLPGPQPSLQFNDSLNTLRAVLYNGDFENAEGIEVNVNNTGWQPYDGSTIQVGNVARPQGYYQFRTAAIAGIQKASATVPSPEFTVTVVIPTPVLFSVTPGSGPVGTSVTVAGTGFTQVSGVSFNGVAASSFSVQGTTSLTAVVPAGVSTGNIVVTNVSGVSNGMLFTVTVPSTVPEQVTNLVATAGNAQVTLSWNTPGNGGSSLTGYKVYQNGVEIGQSTGTNYNVTGLTNGQSYSFTVAAVNAVGTGAQSATQQATPQAPALPTYDTTLTNSFTEAGGIAFAPASTEQFKFNINNNTIGLPQDMIVLVGGATTYITFPAEYAGLPCAFVSAVGTRYETVFTNGPVTL